MALGLQRAADDITVIIARVRRAMPRNADVMAICERCEELARAASGKRRAPDVDRIREQTRLRVARYRAKQRKKRGK